MPFGPEVFLDGLPVFSYIIDAGAIQEDVEDLCARKDNRAIRQELVARDALERVLVVADLKTELVHVLEKLLRDLFDALQLLFGGLPLLLVVLGALLL